MLNTAGDVVGGDRQVLAVDRLQSKPHLPDIARIRLQTRLPAAGLGDVDRSSIDIVEHADARRDDHRPAQLLDAGRQMIAGVGHEQAVARDRRPVHAVTHRRQGAEV